MLHTFTGQCESYLLSAAGALITTVASPSQTAVFDIVTVHIYERGMDVGNSS
jgi:hypothetical protein